MRSATGRPKLAAMKRKKKKSGSRVTKRNVNSSSAESYGGPTLDDLKKGKKEYRRFLTDLITKNAPELLPRLEEFVENSGPLDDYLKKKIAQQKEVHVTLEDIENESGNIVIEAQKRKKG